MLRQVKDPTLGNWEYLVWTHSLIISSHVLYISSCFLYYNKPSHCHVLSHISSFKVLQMGGMPIHMSHEYHNSHGPLSKDIYPIGHSLESIPFTTGALYHNIQSSQLIHLRHIQTHGSHGAPSAAFYPAQFPWQFIYRPHIPYQQPFSFSHPLPKLCIPTIHHIFTPTNSPSPTSNLQVSSWNIFEIYDYSHSYVLHDIQDISMWVITSFLVGSFTAVPWPLRA